MEIVQVSELSPWLEIETWEASPRDISSGQRRQLVMTGVGLAGGGAYVVSTGVQRVWEKPETESGHRFITHLSVHPSRCGVY